MFYNKDGISQPQADAVTSVVIPAYWQEIPVTEIGTEIDTSDPHAERAFFRSSSAAGGALKFNLLKSVTMPEGLKKIHGGAFSNAPLTNLTSLPDSVTHIGDGAFRWSKIALSSFPSSLEHIGVRAFDEVETLTATEFPANVTLANESFRYAAIAFNEMTNVTLDGEKHFEAAVFTNTAVTLSTPSSTIALTFYVSNVASVDLTLSASTASTLNATFANCASLTTVTLRYGTGVTNREIPIYTDTFSGTGTDSLTAIYVPADLVAGFKAAAGWSTHAGIIQAIP